MYLEKPYKQYTEPCVETMGQMSSEKGYRLNLANFSADIYDVASDQRLGRFADNKIFPAKTGNPNLQMNFQDIRSAQITNNGNHLGGTRTPCCPLSTHALVVNTEGNQIYGMYSNPCEIFGYDYSANIERTADSKIVGKMIFQRQCIPRAQFKDTITTEFDENLSETDRILLLFASIHYGVTLHALRATQTRR